MRRTLTINQGPIKILHLISTLDVGGAEQNLFRLVTAMDKGIYENLVVSMTSPGIMGRRIEQHGIPVHNLKMVKGMPEVSAVLKLRFWASLFRPDIIQCWMYHANLLGLTLLKPSKTVWNIRCSDMDLSHYGKIYRLTVMAGARLSHIPSVIISNSYSGKSAHEKLGYHPKKWAIIHNGFDLDTFRPCQEAREQVRAELGIPGDNLVIGIIGRFDPMKDYTTFLKASALFSQTHPETHYILAGRGITEKDQSIRDLMSAVTDNTKYHLLGEREDMPRIFAALDVAASSSFSEGFPNAVGEAMASSLPCVATDAGDTGILMGETGILVKRQSPEELCLAWNTIARMTPEERLNMGLRARQHIMKHYNQNKTTQGYQGLYRQITSGQAN